MSIGLLAVRRAREQPMAAGREAIETEAPVGGARGPRSDVGQRYPDVDQRLALLVADAPDGPQRSIVEMHRSVGRVSDKQGQPLGDVWITLPDTGMWTSSTADGRFRFDRLPPGRHRLLARTVDGKQADAQLEVPGAGVDLVMG